jgi:hypothetical protein
VILGRLSVKGQKKEKQREKYSPNKKFQDNTLEMAQSLAQKQID